MGGNSLSRVEERGSDVGGGGGHAFLSPFAGPIWFMMDKDEVTMFGLVGENGNRVSSCLQLTNYSMESKMPVV